MVPCEIPKKVSMPVENNNKYSKFDTSKSMTLAYIE